MTEELEGFECLDCDVNTAAIAEYYMVSDEVWLTANPEGQGMLCIGCLENRLGRTLTPNDFKRVPVNHGVFKRSERMVQRVDGTDE